MADTNTTTATTTPAASPSPPPPPPPPTQHAELVWARNPEEEAAKAAAAAKAAEEQKLQQQREAEEATQADSSFVNHGLIRWEQGRADWHDRKRKMLLEERAGKNESTPPDHLRQSVPLDVDEIIDILFSPRWRMVGVETGPPKRFPQNVPLVQMVDVLVDLWEAEGLDL